MIQLRPYQDAMMNTAAGHYRSGVRAVLMQLATGGGKSLLGASVAKRSLQRGNGSFWVTHRSELLRQVSGAFTALDVPHGIVAAGRKHGKESVQICSIDTLRRRLDKIERPKLVIWDEAHHIGAATWKHVYQWAGDAWHLGLSATPVRSDGAGLGEFFQRMVQGPSVAELIEQGYLSRYRIFAPSTVDLSGVHTVAGDYNRGELAQVMDKPAIVGNAVAHYRKFADGKKCLVFAVSIEASKHLAQGFRDAGYIAMHCDGMTDDTLREQMLRDFANGPLQVLCSVSLFTEGLDVVGVECVIEARPTQSLGLYLQMIGRGLRTAPGKSECILLDMAGNWHRHGLPDDPREWTLDGTRTGRKAKPAEVAVRVCPQCLAVNRARVMRCGECGHEFVIEGREVLELEGELTEVTKPRVKLEIGKLETFEQVKEYGKMKKYHHRWAERYWQARERARQ